jgi:hypothetical protein
MAIKRTRTATSVEDVEKSFTPANAPSRASKLSMEKGGNDAEHRGFPRAAITTRFKLWIGEGQERSFSAVLTSTNLSVSGAFVESSFFLPVNTKLQLSFELEQGEQVSAVALVVREDRNERAKQTGMGLRFLEFFNQSEVSMAKLFVGERLYEFVQAYLGSKRAKSAQNELERATDLLAAWELRRINTESDPWRSVGDED